MENSSTPVWRRYWIFQANPERYDARSEMRVGHTVNWTVSRFIHQYRRSDIVYLWISGNNPGVYAWGEISGEVYLGENNTHRLPVTYLGVIESPITAQSLRESGKAFAGLTILRNPTGTNFRTTVLEVIALNELIKNGNTSPPPDPEVGLGPNEETFTLAGYLFDYRFDAEVKVVMAYCLNTAHQVNKIVFPKLLFQASLVYLSQFMDENSSDNKYFTLAQTFKLKEFWSRLEWVGLISENSGNKLAVYLSDGLLVKQTVFTILALARRIAISTTGREQIGLRHLMGALVQGATESFQKYVNELFETVGEKLAFVQSAYLTYVESYWPDDNQNAWKLLFAEEIINTETREEEYTPLITRLDSDAAEEVQVDLLNIDEDAIAFAKLLCAKDAAPPLAIGLFGDWGSGKTFFMRRMRQHVNTLTENIAAAATKSSPAYHSKIAQIWFNAWHYQEGNLWASMVNHVFSGLKQELRRLNHGEAEDQFKELMERLDDDRVREQELEQSAERIQTLTKRSIKLEADLTALGELQGGIEMETEMVPSSLLTLKKYSGELESIFDIKGLSNKIHSIVDGTQKFNDFLKENVKGGIKASFARWIHFFMKFKFQFAALIVVVCLAAYLTAFLCQWIMPQMQTMMSTSIVSAGTLIASLAASRFTRLGKILRLLNVLKKEYESAEQHALSELEKKQADNRDKMVKLRIEQQETAAALKLAQKKHDQLNAQYGRESDEAFATFIFARAASEDYKSQLGILNTIRRDFSRLDELLRKQNNSKLPKLSRIILYIDDLDRCDPEVVVNVLQAVHLMLAYPLFMVVVGVDARWLGRSLKKRYPFLVHEREGNQHGDEGHVASTHDYLEKIFQIPFWLKPLDGKRASQMMKGLLRSNTSEVDKNLALKESKRPEIVPDKENQTQESEIFDETEDGEEGYQDLSVLEKAETSLEDVIVTHLVSTRALEMTVDELEFFDKLGAIVGRSPRAVKRFVNLYRILKASQPSTRVAGFFEAGGDFRAPLFLLSVLCGFPKEASAFFNDVKNIKGGGKLVDFIVKAGDHPTSSKWPALHSVLTKAVAELGDISTSLLGDWIVPVARFSYREWVNRD